MAIHIDPQRGVVVRAPKKARQSQVQALLEDKKSWIGRKLSEAKAKAAQVPRHNFMSGDIFLYRGQQHTLVVEEGKNKVEVVGNFLVLGLKPGTPRERIPGILEKWYRARAREAFVQRTTHYSRVFGVEHARICVRGQSKRWGSCSSKGNLNLNWKLIMAPPGILDYVVAHELCHLLHMDHQKEFWNALGNVMPDYEIRRQWLKDNGHILGF